MPADDALFQCGIHWRPSSSERGTDLPETRVANLYMLSIETRPVRFSDSRSWVQHRAWRWG